MEAPMREESLPARCFVCNRPDLPGHRLEEIKNPAMAFVANLECAVRQGWASSGDGLP